MRKQFVVHMALLLTVILLLPLSIKTAHAFSNQHDHEIITCKEGISVSSNGDECKICNFEYTSFLESHTFTLSVSLLVFCELIILKDQNQIDRFNNNSLTLRGPPSILTYP